MTTKRKTKEATEIKTKEEEAKVRTTKKSKDKDTATVAEDIKARIDKADDAVLASLMHELIDSGKLNPEDFASIFDDNGDAAKLKVKPDADTTATVGIFEGTGAFVRVVEMDDIQYIGIPYIPLPGAPYALFPVQDGKVLLPGKSNIGLVNIIEGELGLEVSNMFEDDDDSDDSDDEDDDITKEDGEEIKNLSRELNELLHCLAEAHRCAGRRAARRSVFGGKQPASVPFHITLV